MSTVAFFTAKGAPGATTDAMLTAALWPRRALLIDCDPAGGDMALRLPAASGSALDVSTGMLSLLPLARRPMTPADVLSHAQVALGGTEILAGIASPDQAIAAGSVWSSLADLFAGLPDHDAIIDVGRLYPTSPVLPLVQHADLAVCVVHANLTGVIAARSRLRTLLPALAREGFGPRGGFLVRAADRRAADGAARVLGEEFVGLPYFGWLPEDVVGASLFEGARVPRPERTMLVRSVATVVAQLDEALPPDSKRGAQSTTSTVAAPERPRSKRARRRRAGEADPTPPAAADHPAPQHPPQPWPGPPPSGSPVAYDPPPGGPSGAAGKRGPRRRRQSSV